MSGSFKVILYVSDISFELLPCIWYGWYPEDGLWGSFVVGLRDDFKSISRLLQTFTLITINERLWGEGVPSSFSGMIILLVNLQNVLEYSTKELDKKHRLDYTNTPKCRQRIID